MHAPRRLHGWQGIALDLSQQNTRDTLIRVISAGNAPVDPGHARRHANGDDADGDEWTRRQAA